MNTSSNQIPYILEEFPNQQDGNVAIILQQSPCFEIKLQGSVLAQHSTWFTDQFKEMDKIRDDHTREMDKTRDDQVSSVQYRFKLIPDPTQDLLQLMLAPEIEQGSSPSNDFDPAAGGGQVQIKTEDGGFLPLKREEEEEQPLIKRIQILYAYCNFFRVLFSLPIKLEPTDIAIMLHQSEALVAVGHYLGGLPVVRAPVSTSLSEQRQALYTAIAYDPVRWLNLSIQLKSRNIFGEALVHCAGGFPKADWPTPLTAIRPKAVLKIVMDKAVDLDGWVRRVELQILQNTPCELPTGACVTPTHGRGAWVVVSMFRDWLLAQRREVEKKPHQCTFAANFRQIYEGGESYLKLKDVEAQLSGMLGPKPGFAPAETLDKLKQWAKRVVEPLMKNHLMIDPVAANIPYLTCTNPQTAEVPWQLD